MAGKDFRALKGALLKKAEQKLRGKSQPPSRGRSALNSPSGGAEQFESKPDNENDPRDAQQDRAMLRGAKARVGRR